MGPRPVAIQRLTRKRMVAMLRAVMCPKAAAAAASLAERLATEADGAGLVRCARKCRTDWAQLRAAWPCSMLSPHVNCAYKSRAHCLCTLT